jgi:hypothetical protein
MIAELRELANDLLGQTDDDADMGRTNNTIVVNERPHFETWEDVVRWARAKIVESAKYNGDGEDGRAAWYEKQPSDWRPDFTRVPITPLPKGRDPTVEPMGMARRPGRPPRAGKERVARLPARSIGRSPPGARATSAL